MNLYAVKFREKGESTYNTLLILASSEEEYRTKLEAFVNSNDHYYDIDQRTFKWAGESIPLATMDNPEVIPGDLDLLYDDIEKLAFARQVLEPK